MSLARNPKPCSTLCCVGLTMLKGSALTPLLYNCLVAAYLPSATAFSPHPRSKV